MKLEEHCIHGRDMVEDFNLSLEAIRLAKRSAWGANTEMQVLAVGIQWGIDHAKKIKPCECDTEVGFFCAHCAMENNYIQDLQNKFIALEAENARYRDALQVYADDDVIGTVARKALKGE